MSLCVSLQVARNDSNTYHGSGLVPNDTITWAKGEVLGKGAYGTVSIQITLKLNTLLIAVKQVCLDSSDPDAAKKEYNRLQGEVELLKTLCHSNIVGFLGTSLYQHVVSIFMEYIPGGSIASILHRFGPLPERVLALYTHQILEGVAFLHQNRVIHRDLKGNNVMLMPTGVIKLIDFGCARRLSCLNHTAPNSGELLKSIHGTPYWMAPEIINESGYGRKSDIWSVGCTVFEMATGKPPLAHMDKMAALFYIGARRGLMPSLPDGFSENAKDFVKILSLLSHFMWRFARREELRRDKNKEEEEEGREGKLATELRAGQDTLQYRTRARRRRRKGGRKRWSTCSTSATLGDFAHFGAGSRG
uniref:Mitogen-activated protein kinase kinase kinase 19 n=1 Tax=Xiphophorus couchianus TaxID=32473 RepID=A0A3B5M765_9TELE